MADREECAQNRVAMLRNDAFRMELDPVDGRLPMAKAEDARTVAGFVVPGVVVPAVVFPGVCNKCSVCDERVVDEERAIGARDGQRIVARD